MQAEQLVMLIGLFIGLIIWGALISTVQGFTIVPAEDASGPAKAAYYLMYGAYLSIPFDVLIVYFVLIH
jgi:hypothetical protein